MKSLNKKKTIVIGIGSIFVVACCIVFAKSIEQRATHYETAVVRKGDVIQKALATGTLSPRQVVQIVPQTSGTIKEIFVNYNESVRKGQVLARLGTRDLETEVARAKANAAAAKALSEKEDVVCRQAEVKLTKLEALAQEGAIAQSDYEEAKATFASSQAQKNASMANLEQAKANLDAALFRLDQAAIRTPVQGIVLSRHAEIGQFVSASSSGDPVLFNIASHLSVMELRALVSEADIGKIAIGQRATFVVDAFPDTVFIGNVASVRMEPIIDQKSVSYHVIITINNEALLLRPGMTATIWIETAKKTNVLIAPLSAIVETDGKKRVSILKATLFQKEIMPGLKGQDGFIEIISGLNEGDTVVLATKAR
jgi:HlyD family secretion protein